MLAHVCPWWLTRTFDNPLRRLVQHPERVLRGRVREGMRVADVGCGMGYFTVPLARAVGAAGRVQAVDLQAQQLERVRLRCERAGVLERVERLQAQPQALGLRAPLDFVLAFWMVHEVSDAESFLEQIRDALAPEGVLMIAEPWVHVSGQRFASTLATAGALGLESTPVDGVFFSRAAVLSRG